MHTTRPLALLLLVGFAAARPFVAEKGDNERIDDLWKVIDALRDGGLADNLRRMLFNTELGQKHEPTRNMDVGGVGKKWKKKGMEDNSSEEGDSSSRSALVEGIPQLGKRPASKIGAQRGYTEGSMWSRGHSDVLRRIRQNLFRMGSGTRFVGAGQSVGKRACSGGGCGPVKKSDRYWRGRYEHDEPPMHILRVGRKRGYWAPWEQQEQIWGSLVHRKPAYSPQTQYGLLRIGKKRASGYSDGGWDWWQGAGAGRDARGAGHGIYGAGESMNVLRVG